jgi:hypothetical protein
LLTLVDARDYVSKRVSSAGRPDLFTPDALNALVAASGGSAQMLHLLGGIALFFAAYAGATRVQRDHVVEALAAQVGIITKRRDEAAVSPGATVKPAAAAARAGRRNALDNMRRKILVPFIAGRNLVGRSGLSERLLGRVSAILLLAVALPWWWLQSHPNALPPMAEIIKESERAGGLGEQQRSAADVLQGSARPKLGLADAEQQRQNGVHQGVLRELAMSISQIPAVSSLPELSTAPRAFVGTAPPASSLRPNAAEAGMDARAATAAGNRAESPSRQAAANVQPRPRPDRISGTTAAGQFVRDVVGSARTPAPTARKRRQSEQEAAPVETARISDPPRATLARSALASPVLTAATPSPSGAPARRPSRAASEQFTSAQDVRDDARETGETATFASAARDAAQTARLAREAAAAATAVREAAATASAAREAAAAATAARDAAATASSARQAVVAATAAREAAATASAAIDAAAAATAAREAAATVNAAREAAAAATAARDAAATASAAREAASVASAAKDAVVVAQAAKETVDQVNAARQAAEVAKDAQATVAAAKAAVGL